MFAYRNVPTVSRRPRHARKLPTAPTNLTPKGIRATKKEACETSQRNGASLVVQGKQVRCSASGRVPRTSKFHHPERACKFRINYHIDRDTNKLTSRTSSKRELVGLDHTSGTSRRSSARNSNRKLCS